MGRTFYCEYCDRAFADVGDNRKKHLKGISHERLKKIYYSKIRDLKTLIKEEKQKEICRRFRSTGLCPFEEACTFTHYSPQELLSFELQVAEDERRTETPILPTVEDFFRQRTLNRAHNALGAVTIYDSNNPLKNYLLQSLPPSLQPIPFKEMERTQFVNWG